MPTHLVTGVAGQDGVLLARLLLREGGRVVGTVRPGAGREIAMAPYLNGVEVVPLDLRDTDGFARLVQEIAPDEVYNLAAVSSVGYSWSHPEETEAVNAQAPQRMLEILASRADVRFLQAASVEETAGAVDSPYAKAKSVARAATAAARESGRHASAAVLHVHESVLRPVGFVTRKVTRGAAAIALGQAEGLTLGPADVRRDWGSAADHVRAMRTILAADEPGDYAVGTGIVHSLNELVETAFAAAGIADPWAHVIRDPTLARPTDTLEISSVPEPPAQSLGWKPRHSFEELIAHMVRVDIERLRTGVEESPSYLIDEEAAAR